MAGQGLVKSIFWFSLILTSQQVQARPTKKSIEDCNISVSRMFSAQATRGGKAYRRCILRGGGNGCNINVTQPDGLGNRHLTAFDPVLSRELLRIERHAEDKFPRRCEGEYVQEFFKPICNKAETGSSFNSKEDLTECLYVEHVKPWLNEVHVLISAEPRLSTLCLGDILNQLRLGYRDYIRWDEISFDIRSSRFRHCGGANITNLWNTLVDVTVFYAEPLTIVGE